MSSNSSRLLVFHTAFLGDIILTLPLIQELRRRFPDSFIGVVVNSPSVGILRNHPAVDEVIPFDKRGTDKGLAGLLRTAATIRRRRFSTAFIPHRSIRSAVVVALAGVPRRIGFSASSGRFLFTDVIPYAKDGHEIDRNLSLLVPLSGADPIVPTLPRLYPDEGDVRFVDTVLQRRFGTDPRPLIAIAPGSIWATKRWPEERYVQLTALLVREGFDVVYVGGPEDSVLCNRMLHSAGERRILNAAGRLTLLQSAELLRRCRVLVTNDSAPMHIGVAMKTPVVAIFGATVPEFGFAPRGSRDVVIETPGLSCRPCGIHGGNRCPIGTFVCMLNIHPDRVLQAIAALPSEAEPAADPAPERNT